IHQELLFAQDREGDLCPAMQVNIDLVSRWDELPILPLPRDFPLSFNVTIDRLWAVRVGVKAVSHEGHCELDVIADPVSLEKVAVQQENAYDGAAFKLYLQAILCLDPEPLRGEIALSANPPHDGPLDVLGNHITHPPCNRYGYCNS